VSLPPNDDADLWISWAAYHRNIEKLCLQLHESAWKFDQILCLARGGMRVGDVISRIFDAPLGILSTSSYREAGGTVRGQLDIARYISMTREPIAGRILLVDDLVDTGATIEKVSVHLRQQFLAITEVRTAVLWYKASSRVRPDFFVEFLPTNPWIHQPFEDYDTLRPQHLSAWMNKGKPAES